MAVRVDEDVAGLREMEMEGQRSDIDRNIHDIIHLQVSMDTVPRVDVLHYLEQLHVTYTVGHT